MPKAGACSSYHPNAIPQEHGAASDATACESGSRVRYDRDGVRCAIDTVGDFGRFASYSGASGAAKRFARTFA